jgi:hypothetical protein
MKKVLTLVIMLFAFTSTFAQNVPCVQIMSTGTPEFFKIKSVFPKDQLMVEEWMNKGEKSYRILIVCKDKMEAAQKRLHYSREFYDAFITMRSVEQVGRMFPFDYQFAMNDPDMFKVQQDHTMIKTSDAEFLLNTLFYKFEERTSINSHKKGIKIKDIPYYIYVALDSYHYHLVSDDLKVVDAIEEIIFAWMADMNM